MVFISYRRADSADIAGRLYDRLAAHFSEENVFKDVDSIPPGVDFRRHIERMISSCSVFLVLIGKNWLGTPEAISARSRLEEARDYVRIEVETALNLNIPVVPVLVQGARIPSEEELAYLS